MAVDLSAFVASANGAAGGANPVTGAIQSAASATGASFRYLLATARIESNLNPSAAAPTSSARGLFQFIEQTWLATMKDSGASLGYGAYAKAITRTASGRYTVADPATRAAILNLRRDPAANAAMAGAFTQKNAVTLKSMLGRPATEAELYMAHFLGASGAARLINAASAGNRVAGTDLFPNAASANRPIFFDSTGRPRGAADVYGVLAGKYASAARRMDRTAVAQATQTPTAVQPAQPAQDTAGVTALYSGVPPAARSEDNRAIFHNLFQEDGQRAAVSRGIQQLWNGRGAAAEADAATATGGTVTVMLPSFAMR